MRTESSMPQNTEGSQKENSSTIASLRNGKNEVSSAIFFAFLIGGVGGEGRGGGDCGSGTG